MSRYIAFLSYFGKHYKGWQIQTKDPTIQGAIEDALYQLLQEKIKVVGAGRTDTGVHAKNYVLHFDTMKEFSTKKLVYTLNRLLSWDIVFHSIKKGPDNFHARFNAISRSYQYYIDKIKNPFSTNRFAAFYPYKLNIDLMNNAAKVLLIFKDFYCFCKAHSDVNDHICRIKTTYWEETNTQLIFTITADRFLRNTVRSIVGTMIDVGRGKLSVDNFHEIIQAKDRNKAGTSALACGLFLEKIEYCPTIL